MRKDKDNALEVAALDTTEILADVIISNDVIANIPVIGAAVNILNAVDSIRDRALKMKLRAFSSGVSRLSEAEKSAFSRKLEESKEEMVRVGEMLFLVLDGMSDIEKPEVLGCVFVAFLRGNVSLQEMKLLSQAISMAFSEDLTSLIEHAEEVQKSQLDWMRRLSSAGLSEPVAGNTYGDIGQIYFKPTAIGEKLRKIYLAVPG